MLNKVLLISVILALALVVWGDTVNSLPLLNGEALSTRALAMGGAAVAVDGDARAMWGNPGALLPQGAQYSLERHNVAVRHKVSYSGHLLQWEALVTAFGSYEISANARYDYQAFSFSRRNSSTDPGWGLVWKKINHVNGPQDGYTIDTGFIWPLWAEGYWGLVIHNIATDYGDLPPILRTGLAWRWLDSSLLIALDGVWPRDTKKAGRWQAGFEYHILDDTYLRGGRSPTAWQIGLGAWFGAFCVDYAISYPDDSELDPVHFFALSIGLSPHQAPPPPPNKATPRGRYQPRRAIQRRY